MAEKQRRSKHSADGKPDFYEKTTAKIIELMESGQLPWQKPWDASVGASLVTPINGSTTRPYNRTNGLFLSFVMYQKESSDPRFFSSGALAAQNKFFRARVTELTDAGKEIHPEMRWIYGIKKGAHSFPVKSVWKVDRDKQGNLLPEDEQYWAKKYVPVFHASDCTRREFHYDKEGKPILDEEGKQKYTDHPLKAYTPKSKGYTHEETYEMAEAILRASGAKIINGQVDRSAYSPQHDRIMLPPKEAFPSLGDYYATALHELAHWTGHPSRLKRDLTGNKGTEAYAKEELRAELASAFLSMELGLPAHNENTAAYLQFWVKSLKDDKMEIFKASNDAKDIADYVMSFLPERFRGKEAEEETALVPVQADVTVLEPLSETPQKLSDLGDFIRTDDPRILQLPEEAQAKGTSRFYKYYLDHRPYDIGTVPKEGLYFVDSEDKGGNFGAAYYEKQLPASVAAAYELRPDVHYFANKALHITVYHPKKGVHFQLDNPPRLFRDYDAVYQGNYLRTGVRPHRILEELHNHPPEGQRPIQSGDLVEMDGCLCAVKDVGCQLLELHPYQGDFILTNSDLQKGQQMLTAAKSAVGEEKYKIYREKLHEQLYRSQQIRQEFEHQQNGVFVATDEKDNGGIRFQLAGDYAEDFHLRTYQFGLSGFTPTDQKGWHDADYIFAAKAVEAHQGNNLCEIADTIQQNSPYAVISGDRNYGRTIVKEALKERTQRLEKEAAQDVTDERAVANAR